MFEDGLRALPVVELREQTAPASGDGLADRGIAETLDRVERALLREGDEILRLRHARLLEHARGRQLVAADAHDVRRVHDAYALGLEHLRDRLVLVVRDAAREHHVVLRAERLSAEDGVRDELKLARNAEAFRRLFKQLLLSAQAREENAQDGHYSPQSS